MTDMGDSPGRENVVDGVADDDGLVRCGVEALEDEVELFGVGFDSGYFIAAGVRCQREAASRVCEDAFDVWKDFGGWRWRCGSRGRGSARGLRGRPARGTVEATMVSAAFSRKYFFRRAGEESVKVGEGFLEE